MSLALDFCESFCVVCLKSIKPPLQIECKNREKIKKFIKFLTRFAGNKCAVSEGLLNNYACLTCEECTSSIDTFSETYHQIKCLELELDLELDKLVNIIKLSSLIPTRWTNLNKVLQLTRKDDKNIIVENQNEILTIRQNIIEAGLHRLSKSLPRVLLKCHAYEEYDTPPSNLTDNPLTRLNQAEQINQEIILFESDNYPQLPIKIRDPAIPVLEDYNDLSEPPLEIPSTSTNLPSGPAYMNGDQYPSQTVNLNQKSKRKVNKSNKQELSQQRSLLLKNSTIVYIDNVEYFRCNHCKTPFLDLRLLKRHFSSTTCLSNNQHKSSQSVKCLECKETFDKNEDLWVHQNQFHSSGRKKVCPKCGKGFMKTSNFKLHMEYHKGPANWKWECSHCNKTCATFQSLKRHEKSHQREPLSHILYSKSKAVRKDDVSCKLKRQEKNPTKETLSDICKINIGNYVCLQCGKKYKRKDGLKLHLAYHQNPKEWKWECKKCGKKYPHGYRLREHFKSHLGVKPKPHPKVTFTCQLCERKFGRRWRLKCHLVKVHRVEEEQAKRVCISNEGNNRNEDATLNDLEINSGLDFDLNYVHKMEMIDNDDGRDTMEVSIIPEANMDFNDEHPSEHSYLEMAVGSGDGQEFIGPFGIEDSASTRNISRKLISCNPTFIGIITKKLCLD